MFSEGANDEGCVPVRRPADRDHEFTEFVMMQRAALVRVAALLVSGDRVRADDSTSPYAACRLPDTRSCIAAPPPASPGGENRVLDVIRAPHATLSYGPAAAAAIGNGSARLDTGSQDRGS